MFVRLVYDSDPYGQGKLTCRNYKHKPKQGEAQTLFPRPCQIIIDYVMVGKRVLILFTSCDSWWQVNKNRTSEPTVK